MAIINPAPSSLNEIVERINRERVRDDFKPLKNVLYPVNRGFVVNYEVLRITGSTLDSLCILLPQVGQDGCATVQVKKISMPHHNEPILDYLARIDSILKDLDDHAKFVEL